MMAVLWFAQCIGSDIANAHYWCSAWRVSFSYSEWRMSEIINMRGVSKSFVHGKVETFALRDFELRISEGELVAITGPSGAGKSTFLNIAGLLDSYDEGSYLLMGQEAKLKTEAQQAKLRNELFGFIFQGFNLIPELNVYDNIDIPLRYRGVSASNRANRINEVLERVGLESRKFHFPAQLSGGQQQRVAIARAIVGEPKLLLADEPTGSLDSLMARQVIDLLEEINASGVAVLIVTHDIELARRANRRIHMVDGRLLDSGYFNAQLKTQVSS